MVQLLLRACKNENMSLLTIITTGAGAFAGWRISYNLQRSDKRDRNLGIIVSVTEVTYYAQSV